MLDKLKDNLTNVVAIIGVVGAIGAGFTVYGQMQEQINNLAGLDLNPLVKEIAEQNVKIEKLQTKVENLVIPQDRSKDIAVLEKTIKVLELEIQELKASSKNPLAN